MPATISGSVKHRDRWIVLFCLIGVTALAWVYLAVLAAGMDSNMAMPAAAGKLMTTVRSTPWTVIEFAAMSAMWAIMMVGMMTPSAVPMVLMFVKLDRNRQHNQRRDHRPLTRTGLFVAGYFVIWSLFSLVTAALQMALQSSALLSPMMTSTSALYSGGILITAGVYQWLPLKSTCLRHCQTPLGFFMTHWRDDASGAFQMGLSHGAFCVGCCWAAMALLFVGGVMNLLWVAAIAIFVLAEKIAPPGPWPLRLSGAALVAWGAGVLFLAQ